MTKFLKSNSIINLEDNLPEVLDVLPTATYALKMDPTGKLYLEQIEDFKMPDRLFGSIAKTAERVVKTYADRTGVTGMLLTGEKGSGKTLLGKKVALDLMANNDQPIIVVNIPISGDSFGIFLQKLGKPVTLFFDEFEKTYAREEYQNGLLTILDGVYPIKMLAILTSNDQSKMISPLLDRPGRVYYKIDYKGLEYAFIMEYAAEKLTNKDHLAELGRLATMADLNFDQLQALIEEMNRYDESVKEAVQLLNISIGGGSRSLTVLRMTDAEGKSHPADSWNARTFYGDITSLGEDEDGDEHEGIKFGYLTALPEPITIGNWRMALAKSLGDGDSAYESWNTIRSLFSSKLSYKDSNDAMPGDPHTMTFGAKTQIEVNQQGHITLTNEAGESVVLEKTVFSYTKTF